MVAEAEKKPNPLMGLVGLAFMAIVVFVVLFVAPNYVRYQSRMNSVNKVEKARIEAEVKTIEARGHAKAQAAYDEEIAESRQIAGQSDN